MRYLIVGLGNPGAEYQDTRHNVGFEIVQAFATAHRIAFRHVSALMGDVAQGEIEGKQVVLLLPTTFMNHSGDAVQRCMEEYQIPLENLLVVCDDVALSFGVMRIRARGSDGGHNGLKSIASHLRTQFYARLRIGIGSPTGEDLADYVLGRFTAEEKMNAAAGMDRAIDILELWVVQGAAAAMQKANARIINKNEET